MFDVKAARVLPAISNYTSDSPKFMHITLIALPAKSQPVSAYKFLNLIRVNVSIKKMLLNASALPRTAWVKVAVVVGDEQHS